VCFGWFLYSRTSAPSDPLTAEVSREAAVRSGDPKHYPVAVALHLADHAMWKEFLPCIENTANVASSMQLYVTLVRGYKYTDRELTATQRQIQRDFPGAVVLVVNNFGMDIAGFLAVLQKMIQIGATHQAVLKLHSKSNKEWRNKLLSAMCSNQATVLHVLERFQRDASAGIIGTNDYCWFIDTNDKDKITNHFAPRFNLNVSFYEIWDSKNIDSIPFDPHYYMKNKQNVDIKAAFEHTDWPVAGLHAHWKAHGHREHRIFSKDVIDVYRTSNFPKFIAGSVFWVNVQPLLNFFQVHDIQKELEYLKNEVGYVSDVSHGAHGLVMDSKFTHCWERMWVLLLQSQDPNLRALCTHPQKPNIKFERKRVPNGEADWQD